MQLEQRRKAMLQLYLSDQQFHCLLRCDLYYGGNIKQAWKNKDKAWTKWPKLYRHHIWMHFLKETCSIVIQISWRSSAYWANIDSDNTLKPRQNGHHYAADIFKCIFLKENVWVSFKISLKYVPKVRINNILALFQMIASRRPGDKLLSEPMLVSFLAHICVNRPQWVNSLVANWGQVITWTNDDPFHWRIYPSPGCNELSLPMTAIWRHIAHLFYGICVCV